MQRIPSLLTVKYVRRLLKPENLTNFDRQFRLIEANPGEQFHEHYKSAHIPRAVFLNTMECTQPCRTYPRPVPNKDCFKKYAGSLGISNRHHLILYDRSPFGFYASSRMWWIFRLFGHENVSIMNGGIGLWQAQGGELTQEVPNYKSETFEINENSKLIRNFEHITANIHSGHEQVVDVRGKEEFHKIENDLANNIPKSFNVPYNEFFDKENGVLKSVEELKQLIESSKVDLSRPTVASCLTGMTACTLAYVAYMVNQVSIPVYSGSWTEFSQKRKI